MLFILCSKPWLSVSLGSTNDEEDPPLPFPASPKTTTKRKFDGSRVAPFDKDIRDDCRSLLVHCQSDIFAHVYLQCPASCTRYLQEEGMIGTSHENPDALYDVGTLRTYQGKRVDADRFEGYVTVLAMIPLLPGMAVYYYEMLEHLHTVFAPKVEFVVIPMDHEHGIHIKLRDNAKVIVLEEESSVDTHPWIKHLTSIKPRTGAVTKDHKGEIMQTPLHTDRVTVFIVSADGYYVEKVVSPSMAVLEQKVGVYLKTIDYEL